MEYIHKYILGGTVWWKSNQELLSINLSLPTIFYHITPSIAIKQNTVDINGNFKEIEISGRHDPCVVIRAVPVVSAMTAIVICDHYLRAKAKGVFDESWRI